MHGKVRAGERSEPGERRELSIALVCSRLLSFALGCSRLLSVATWCTTRCARGPFWFFFGERTLSLCPGAYSPGPFGYGGLCACASAVALVGSLSVQVCRVIAQAPRRRCISTPTTQTPLRSISVCDATKDRRPTAVYDTSILVSQTELYGYSILIRSVHGCGKVILWQ